MLRFALSQHLQRYNTLVTGMITQYMYQIACIYIVVHQQKQKHTNV